VVAVVAVVGFQTWFNTYQSGLNTKVEQQSASGSAVTIERVEDLGTNANVYLKNGGSAAINSSTIKVSAKAGYTDPGCTDRTSVNLPGSSVSNFSITCTGATADDVYNVVVVTGTGVYSGEAIVR
ncbi:MAG: hypothetical protein KC589_08830, partial [Nanoarchaeota archaeon]|nr:hypothetical protein [Nanoarchaeota archaeon]